MVVKHLPLDYWQALQDVRCSVFTLYTSLDPAINRLIVTAILAGRQPTHLTNQMMIRHMQVPLDWQEQRRIFGFPV